MINKKRERNDNQKNSKKIKENKDKEKKIKLLQNLWKKFMKKKFESVLKERGIYINEINDLDYGDIFEISLNEGKMDVFFIKNSFFV